LSTAFFARAKKYFLALLAESSSSHYFSLHAARSRKALFLRIKRYDRKRREIFGGIPKARPPYFSADRGVCKNPFQAELQMTDWGLFDIMDKIRSRSQT
jgi:hypothetical protein